MKSNTERRRVWGRYIQLQRNADLLLDSTFAVLYKMAYCG